MRNYRNIKSILLLTAMSGLTVGCQTGSHVSQSNKSQMRATPSKCEKMLQVAERFEQQGLHDQARHVYNLIPRDSTYYPQAVQGLADLGTSQQPAKINIAAKNPPKRLPMANAPLPKADTVSDVKAEMLIKASSQQPALVTIETESKPEYIADTREVEVIHPEQPAALEPMPLTLTECDQSSSCQTCEIQSQNETTANEMPVCPSCHPLPVKEQSNRHAPFKVEIVAEPAAESECLAPGIEPLFVRPLQQGVLNQGMLNYKELMLSHAMTSKEWKELNELGVDAAPLLVDIEQMMHTGTTEEQLHAAYSSYRISGTLELASGRFQHALRSTDANVVGLAAYYLGEIGSDAQAFSKELDDLVANGNSIVRVYAAEASIKIRGPLPEYQLALCHAAEEGESSARVLAIVGLARVGMKLDPHVAESLFLLINDNDHDVAAQSMMTLALLRPVEPRFKDLVLKIMNNQSHHLHETARVAWECINDQYVTQSQAN